LLRFIKQCCQPASLDQVRIFRVLNPTDGLIRLFERQAKLRDEFRT
jgi:hypothetical protein